MLLLEKSRVEYMTRGPLISSPQFKAKVKGYD